MIDSTVAMKVIEVVTTSSPGPMPAARKSDRQGVRAARGADAVRSLAVRGELTLEHRDLGASDEAAMGHHTVDRRLDLTRQSRVLGLQVK